MQSGDLTRPPSVGVMPAALAGARKRPLWAVFLLTAGTSSFYFFVHLGLMWAEMKRARQDPTMKPVGHALAQFVPFYGWFRFHAHIRALDEMLTAAGSPIRVSAGRATTMYVIIALFGLLAVELAVSLEPGLSHALAAVFLLVALGFVYRSFYGMRIESRA